MSINLTDTLRFAIDKSTLTEALLLVEDIPGAISNLRVDPTDGSNLLWDTYNDQGVLQTGSLKDHANGKLDIYRALKLIMLQGNNITITPDDDNKTLTISATAIAGGGGVTGLGRSEVIKFDIPVEGSASSPIVLTTI